MVVSSLSPGTNEVEIIFLVWLFLAMKKNSVAERYLFGNKFSPQNVHLQTKKSDLDWLYPSPVKQKTTKWGD